MLSEYLSQDSINEIGSSLAEVFDIPVAIANLHGKFLFVSDNWVSKKEFGTPEFIRYLDQMSQSNTNPLVQISNDEVFSLIPIKCADSNCAYGIVDLAEKISLGTEKITDLLTSIKRALSDISVYASWEKSKQIDDVNSETQRINQLYLRGSMSHEDVLNSLLEIVRQISSMDTVAIIFSDENTGTLEQGYQVGDKEILPDCLGKCGLAWWALHSKQPLIVANPYNDPRCKKGFSNKKVKSIAFWPLYVKEKSFGLLCLASTEDRDIQHWQHEYTTNIAFNLSLMFDAIYLQRENYGYMRKMSAINEVCRVLSSSLGLNSVLNLVADMAINIFDAKICCVYLDDYLSSEVKLQAARGIRPDEAEVLAKRFVPGEKVDNQKIALADFSIQMKEKHIGFLSLGGFPDGGLSGDDRDLASTFASMVAVAVENSRMLEDTQRTLTETIRVLGLAIEARDQNMKGHSGIVKDLAISLAETLGLSREEIRNIEWASLLHNIGKLGVPESILGKAGPLTTKEFEAFKKHSIIGAEILGAVGSFGTVSNIVRHHHERFDGKGYPDGLSGTHIPLESRILAIADTFVSLISKRAYRATKDHFEAMTIIKASAGKQFDPKLVEAFEKVVRQRYSLTLDNSENAPVNTPQLCLGPSELGLTEREAEILTHIAVGLANKEIAATLYISEKTVKTHVTRILKKLNVPDRTKAAIYAIQKGIIKR